MIFEYGDKLKFKSQKDLDIEVGGVFPGSMARDRITKYQVLINGVPVEVNQVLMSILFELKPPYSAQDAEDVGFEEEVVEDSAAELSVVDEEKVESEEIREVKRRGRPKSKD